MSNQNITFLGVGRVKDQIVLATAFDRIISQEKNEIEKTFQQAVTEALASMSPGRREKRSFAGGVMYLLPDTKLCCVYGVSVRGKNYPERVAYQLLNEFMVAVQREHDRDIYEYTTPGSLNKSLKRPLKDLMDKYDNPAAVDKTAEVHGKVDHVKGIMQDNINKVLATHANISDLEQKTDHLNQNAQNFHQTAGDIRRVMWWQKTKVTILLGIVVLAIVGYIIMIIVNAVGGGGSSSSE